MSNPEIGLEDDDIAALLDELEAEVAGTTPAPAAAPAPNATTVAAMTEAREIAAAKSDDIESFVASLEEIELDKVTAGPGPNTVAVVEDRAAKPVKAVNPAKVKAAKPEPEPEIPVPKLPTREHQAEVENDAIGASDKPASTKASLNFYVDAAKFQEETRFTEATLDDAMMKQSALRAYYGTMAANAEAQHSRLKVRFEVLEAKLYDEHRKTLESSGSKVTEKAVESAVKLDPRWATAKNAVIEAETIASVNRAMVFSLADRRDMLIQLGADRREEFKGNLRIVAQNEQAESLAQRAANLYKGNAGVQ